MTTPRTHTIATTASEATAIPSDQIVFPLIALMATVTHMAMAGQPAPQRSYSGALRNSRMTQ